MKKETKNKSVDFIVMCEVVKPFNNQNKVGTKVAIQNKAQLDKMVEEGYVKPLKDQPNFAKQINNSKSGKILA